MLTTRFSLTDRINRAAYWFASQAQHGAGSMNPI